MPFLTIFMSIFNNLNATQNVLCYFLWKKAIVIALYYINYSIFNEKINMSLAFNTLSNDKYFSSQKIGGRHFTSVGWARNLVTQACESHIHTLLSVNHTLVNQDKRFFVVRTISSNTLSSDSFQYDSCLYGFTRCAQLCETDNTQFILCYLLRDFAQASGFMILLYNCISWWTRQVSL